MVKADKFREFALGYEHSTEQPHFEKESFRINKKIFATLDRKTNRATLKLAEVEQSVFVSYDKTVFYPANGAWGKQGWTIVELEKVSLKMIKEALEKAYNHVISKK